MLGVTQREYMYRPAPTVSYCMSIFYHLPAADKREADTEREVELVDVVQIIKDHCDGDIGGPRRVIRAHAADGRVVRYCTERTLYGCVQIVVHAGPPVVCGAQRHADLRDIGGAQGAKYRSIDLLLEESHVQLRVDGSI